MVISLVKKWNEILQSMFTNYSKTFVAIVKISPLIRQWIHSHTFYLNHKTNSYVKIVSLSITAFYVLKVRVIRRVGDFKYVYFKNKGGNFTKRKGKIFYELTIRGSVPSARLQAVLGV